MSDQDAEIWPLLAAAMASDWDIDAVTRMLRACIYLGLANAPGCQWALQWLLDQETDGRFGLLETTLARSGAHGRGWVPHFDLTVGALWTLAEIQRPGFMVR